MDLQKKLKEARVVWEEGIAKYPRTAAKIWEDLTILWGNEADHYKAAYEAGAAHLGRRHG